MPRARAISLKDLEPLFRSLVDRLISDLITKHLVEKRIYGACVRGLCGRRM